MLDLFSGIGGFSLGLERSGLARTVAFCEIDPYCRRVLKKHWPEVPCYDDIRELTAARIVSDGIERPRIICGGFPCQDISVAGSGAGLAGERSGLWFEYARIIGEFRPDLVFVENVAALLGRGLGVVLGDLAALGYDAEWHCIPASHIGAPHRRDRLWIVANARSGRRGGSSGREIQQSGRTEAVGAGEDVAYAAQLQRNGGEHHGENCGCEISQSGDGSGSDYVADANLSRLQGRQETGNLGGIGTWIQQQSFGRAHGIGSIWESESSVGRVVNGLPDRSHRLKALGNAVVPQIPDLLGRAVKASLYE